ncbi:fimbria/pilus periplasmic chaperone [Utexia brackfieldae]|uniref:fimbria/pilus periplasmic chaperone n=1 Tax=Utexia brackfieldae TaxID=3074108 RepID=UPI00370D7C68
MKTPNIRYLLLAGSVLISTFLSSNSFAAISLDRTRVIFDGNHKSESINVANKNKQLPYLAQAWIENSQGQKISSPFVVLPPIQRIEPGKASQVRIEALPEVKNLPQDRESLFYFNLREIPPKSDKQNVLQLALQTKIKLFYRPAAINEIYKTNWQQKLQLIIQGSTVKFKNDSPFYVTIINAAATKAGLASNRFDPVMIAPLSETKLAITANLLGNAPVLTYINDYGGRPNLFFQCKNNVCHVINDSQ